uniref:Uncharacterized protein n=1 Tax=Human betaherpesvirus 6 TaxID=10368 RepID=A0A1W6GBN7_9BETA|nr:hypothetical protein [Human betaherpesvirus 6]QFV26207.1 hypothetical protein [Human betaherpesvirus 6]QFV47796.1 hypothetical protein [Human betaherpesvirus 6]QFV49799.1 hypothetical protein [Human betaherpesvirus 6]QFX16113.1 hypothetical protein [Human betaherpesvirus 6]
MFDDACYVTSNIIYKDFTTKPHYLCFCDQIHKDG